MAESDNKPSDKKPLMPYCFVAVESALVNMHELLAVVTDRPSGDTVLLFKGGIKIAASSEAKQEIIDHVS